MALSDRSDDDEGRLLGAKRNYRLSVGQASELSVPFDRELLEETVKVEIGGLESFKDGFDDAGGEQGEPQDTAEVGFVYGFGFGEIADRQLLGKGEGVLRFCRSGLASDLCRDAAHAGGAAGAE